ncbi:MAG TPA: xanthine dehydrogenase family protein subunit M, partial [Xanthobacteraceae bacterium]|jgi:carbon-monoxide dehydrogenase medium subunit
LGDRDVLTRIRVPIGDGRSRAAFAEFARRQGDYALVGLAACARADGTALADVRLAYFGVGAIPLRARHAEAALAKGKLEDAVAALRAELQPEDDLHASAAVRSHLAGVLLRRVAAQMREKPL